eukprot:gnl/MRDRNA2_/MRDRNA2_76559_c0_seq2.p1 gnl/MRDRNA2_/MRDRNA2_76559_c0~~gnl/MRDRNA2_/MRDRNA2_76559_c0_seq2.p1  ORF type:complete len:222 (-),score=53.68 gnl/MRDRNA2_/MRDRNA2_76559_c0_seq2:646-1311(-)
MLWLQQRSSMANGRKTPPKKFQRQFLEYTKSRQREENVENMKSCSKMAGLGERTEETGTEPVLVDIVPRTPTTAPMQEAASKNDSEQRAAECKKETTEEGSAPPLDQSSQGNCIESKRKHMIPDGVEEMIWYQEHNVSSQKPASLSQPQPASASRLGKRQRIDVKSSKSKTTCRSGFYRTSRLPEPADDSSSSCLTSEDGDATDRSAVECSTSEDEAYRIW